MIVQEVGISQGSFDTNLIEELAGKDQKCRPNFLFLFFLITFFSDDLDEI